MTPALAFALAREESRPERVFTIPNPPASPGSPAVLTQPNGAGR